MYCVFFEKAHSARARMRQVCRGRVDGLRDCGARARRCKRRNSSGKFGEVHPASGSTCRLCVYSTIMPLGPQIYLKLKTSFYCPGSLYENQISKNYGQFIESVIRKLRPISTVNILIKTTANQ